MTDPIDVDALKRDGILPHLDDVVATLRGQKPICRATYKSKCCLGPVDVYHGRIEGTADNWAVPIIRVCVTCGHACEGVPLEAVNRREARRERKR